MAVAIIDKVERGCRRYARSTTKAVKPGLQLSLDEVLSATNGEIDMTEWMPARFLDKHRVADVGKGSIA